MVLYALWFVLSTLGWGEARKTRCKQQGAANQAADDVCGAQELPTELQTASERALQAEGTVHKILLLIGPGHFVYMCSIAKSWLRCHRTAFLGMRNRRQLLVKARRTAWRAAFTSVSRLIMAQGCGLPDLSSVSKKLRGPGEHVIQFELGRTASIAVLKIAFDSGLQHNSGDLFEGAASSGDIAKVQYLLPHMHKLPRDCGKRAIATGSIAMLQLLRRAPHTVQQGSHDSARNTPTNSSMEHSTDI
jgi:hypothetical protein